MLHEPTLTLDVQTLAGPRLSLADQRPISRGNEQAAFAVQARRDGKAATGLKVGLEVGFGGTGARALLSGETDGAGRYAFVVEVPREATTVRLRVRAGSATLRQSFPLRS